MRSIIGMDIGGTKCAVLLARETDGNIEILDALRFPTLTHLGYEQAMDRLLAAADILIERHELTQKGLDAIGVSCGGPLDSRSGRILSPPNLPGWDDVPIVELLTERYGVPVFLQNDANACALVEWKLGAGRGTENMVFLTMGTGMGAGIIAEGRLLRGVRDLGGEVGHLRLAEDGPVGFGKAGSFEGFTSGGGIARYAAMWARTLPKPPVWADEELTTKKLAEYAKGGDADALRLFEMVGERLGQGISLLIDTLNPERVVIGSIFVRCEALLRPAMERVIAAEAIPAAAEAVRIVPAQTGEAIGDLASIVTALYGLTVQPQAKPSAFHELDALIRRIPALSDCLPDLEAAYRMLDACLSEGHKVLLCGNGGSAADAEHIVGELMKGFRLKRPLPQALRDALRPALGDLADLLQEGMPAISLTQHSALSSAVANDLHADLGFAQQVMGYGQPGDVLWGISTSGNAKNVCHAAAVARAKGMKVLAMTGAGGGRLAGLADVTIAVPERETALVQELHLPVYHALCAMLEAERWTK